MDAQPAPVVHYGDWFVAGELAERTSIHGSGTIDIQVNPATREIVAVWFRCRTLPFTVSTTDDGGDQPSITVTAVEYLESPSSHDR